jgi:hypothetical protein
MSKASSTTKSSSVANAKSAVEPFVTSGADALETAKFVADFTLELASLARHSQFDLLAYLLDMARLEAIRLVQMHHPEA